MRVQYVAAVAAVALVAATDGLQVAPNSAKATSLRVPAEARYQPYVEGKTDRFLTSEAKNAVASSAPPGYEFSTLQGDDDNDMLQQEDDDDYEVDSESSSSEDSGSDERLFGRKKKRKKRKKSKATETPTPTPTATPALNGTDTPVTTGYPSSTTPAPTTKAPRGILAWLRRRFGD
ncbi:hypothetical protein PHYPSEUDO_015619 [Phytophthora pseudosyringae]|uniref:RxLR effector protein n=1 Tax=Phytophthora pseudosyringae TaxID=221518 RepID=A0A8T1V3Z3_9STRA|nr:hypothetical protein PHYPSEUDO_015619 [Phytophthora pseudosyringae]